MDWDFIRQRYDHELARQERLTAALALPVGILGGIGTAGVAMCRTFVHSSEGLRVLFYAGMVGAGVAVTVCLVCLSIAFVAQTYAYLPRLGEMQEFETQLVAFLHQPGRDRDVDEDVRQEIQRHMIEAADTNARSNERRDRWMHWSRVALLLAVAFAYGSGVVYISGQVRSAMPVDDNAAPTAVTPNPAVPPQRPTFPPNRIIKEGRKPRPDTPQK